MKRPRTRKKMATQRRNNTTDLRHAGACTTFSSRSSSRRIPLFARERGKKRTGEREAQSKAALNHSDAEQTVIYLHRQRDLVLLPSWVPPHSRAFPPLFPFSSPGKKGSPRRTRLISGFLRLSPDSPRVAARVEVQQARKTEGGGPGISDKYIANRALTMSQTASEKTPSILLRMRTCLDHHLDGGGMQTGKRPSIALSLDSRSAMGCTIYLAPRSDQ